MIECFSRLCAFSRRCFRLCFRLYYYYLCARVTRAHFCANRFAVVLRQTRPLLYNPSFQHLLLKLVGDKEEVEIATEIQKALKQAPPLAFQATTRPPYQRRTPPTCFGCGKRGHLAKNCWFPGLLETSERNPYTSAS